MAEFAQYEREMIQERTHEKRWAMAKRGMWTGGMVPIGYQLKEKKLLINPAEADIVRRIYLLYREHANLSVVAQMLNRQGLTTKRRTSTTGKMISGTRWDKKRVARVLQNPVYIGVIRYTHPKDEQEYLYPGKHERIIADKQLWDATQKILGRNRELRKSYKKNKYELLFLGLIKCGNCGRVMTNTSRRKPSGKLYLYYKCNSVDGAGKSTCPSKLVSGSAIEGVLVKALSSLGGDRSLLEKSIRKANQGRSEGIGNLHEERRSLINRKSETKKKIDHLVEVLEQMADRRQLTSITNKIAELEATHTALDQELTRVQSNIDLLQERSIDQATYVRLFQRFSKVFADLSFEEQRNLVILLVKEVIYRPNRVTVRFWGDLKEMDIPWINQNSHPLPSGKTPMVGWECHSTPRASLPDENLFQVVFPLYLCHIRRGEQRISLSPKEILPKPPKSYPNPLLLALRYKNLLDIPGIGSQTALARKVGVSPARISQILRLLKLPPEIQQSVI